MRKILIVDDNRMNIAFAKGCLEDEYELSSANSGEEAVAILAEWRFDLVLPPYLPSHLPSPAPLFLTSPYFSASK